MTLKKVIKAIIVTITILSFIILTFYNTSNATTGKRHRLQTVGPAVSLLRYKGELITSNYVAYLGKLINNPAYCLDVTKKFVTKELSYYVTEQGVIEDIMLWRYIVNGYPYKTPEELGCIGKDEPYVATQQAIYCYIYGRDIEDYKPIGEAGERTLQAMKNIIENAQNSKETPAPQSVKINKINSGFNQDEIDKNFASKIYEVTSTLPMKSYKVILENIAEEDKADFKITDLNNNIKTEFTENEKFKILIPIEKIENLEGTTNFKITIEAEVESKPVIYAVPDNELYQNFAIPGTATEEIVNETTEETTTPEIEEEPEEIPVNPPKKLPVTGM